MPTRKDALMMQVMFAFAQGCDGVEIDEEAGAWFHGRYYDWIDTPKKDPRANGQSPQDVWGQEFPAFAGHFREIGKRAAASGGTIGQDVLQTSALSVEQENDCPWCPLRE